MNLYKFLLKKDSTMLEINPFVETQDGRGMHGLRRVCTCSLIERFHEISFIPFH